MTDPAPAMDWLKDLNPRQREAVTHGAGPLLVVAGAGSGKTRTLAYRVAYLLATGADPARILLLTFTRRAAEEMIRRATAIAAHGRPGAAGRVWGGTFHAVANRLLRMYARQAGLSPEFTVMDQGDAQDLMNVVRHDLGLHRTDKRFPRKQTCLAIYSRCVNGEEPLDAVVPRYFPWCAEWLAALKPLFREYVVRKQKQNVLDYDDLLIYWARLLDHPDLAAAMGGRFDHILVDEYQDTNRVQAGILRGMRRGNANIMVVGDDAQSIYSFRAASVSNMFDFPQQFPGARQVTLDQNYRSTTPVLTCTNRLIAHAAHRYTKDLWSERAGAAQPDLVMCRDEAAQDEYLLRRILAHREEGIPLRKQAVLFRAAHHSDSLELELTRRNIPFHKYGGLRFLEAAHVKDLVAFLRVAENPRDEMAWFRVLQLIDGVGPATAARVVGQVQAQGGGAAALAECPVPGAARAGVAALAAMLGDLARMGNGQPAGQVERVRRYYDPLLAARYENPQVRMRDLEHLEQVAAGYRSRQKFLVDLQLDPPTSTSDLAGPPVRDEDWLNLSTIHSAKGCEWDVVYLIHAADGFLPSDMATGSADEIEEERRLAYVAMTRARDFLHVTWPMRYYHRWHRHGDRHTYAQVCRFFTADVQAAMAVSAYGTEDDGDAAPGGGAAKPAVDIAAAVRSMWE